MELAIHQQIFEQLGQAKKVLIALPQQADADIYASALALRQFLGKLEKEVNIVAAGTLPENLAFLPGAQDIRSDVPGGKGLIVSVNTSSKKLEEISYQTYDNKVDIFLKPKQEMFTPEDISFGTDKSPVDAVVILGAQSLESLGKVFERSADLFFESPKINIDNQAGNEYYGAINLVDITASSIAEILNQLLSKFEEQLIDEGIATALLTGIIAKTHSFQHARTTPKAFLAASELIALGGKQQEIIKNIYKTKSLPLLKLWGRALARLKTVEASSVIYSLLTRPDFEKAGAESDHLTLVLKELIDNISLHNLVAVIAEFPEDGVHVVLAAHPQVNIEAVAQALGGESKLKEVGLAPYKVMEISFAKSTLAEVENSLLLASKTLTPLS